MLHHVSVGVRDVEQSAKFYDAVLGKLGFKRSMEFLPYAVAYGSGGSTFWVQLPVDQKPASVGNGTHIGFAAKTKRAAQAFYNAALAAGGSDEGAPGPRPDYGPNYYGAFVRDLDGNKIEAVVIVEAKPDAKAAKKAAKKAKSEPVEKKKKKSKKGKAKRR